MRGFVDIHSHILPGIDDGAANWGETLEMMAAAQAERIATVIATPHYGVDNVHYSIDEARQLIKEATSRAQELHINTKLLLGSEIYYVPGIVRDVANGRAATMAGSSYVMIEFDESTSFDRICSAVHEFTRECYKPIIAHAERYTCLRDRDLERIQELRDLGAYIQVNTCNFDDNKLVCKKNNPSREQRKEFAKALLVADLIDFIASDSHNTGTRPPMMKTAFKTIEKMIGEEQLRKITYKNILAMVSNKDIER